MDWEVVKYHPRHRPAVLALMAEVQRRPASPERFIWEFEDNPVGDTNIYLATDGGDLIGVSCHNAFRMRVRGQEHMVSFPLNVLTKQSHRGRGVFSTLEQANEEHANQSGVSLMLSFPNAASAPIFLGRLGWLALNAPRVVGRTRSLLPTRPRLPVSLEPIGAFDSWADEIWAENHELDRCMVRNTTYLQWRFVHCPTGYRVLVVRADREIVGYIVTATTTKRGIRVAYVANALLLPGYRYLYRDLRRAALAGARAPLVLDLDGPLSRGGGTPAPGIARYMSLPKRLNLIAKSVASQFDEAWLRAQPWVFQLGDLDFF